MLARAYAGFNEVSSRANNLATGQSCQVPARPAYELRAPSSWAKDGVPAGPDSVK